MFLKLSSKIQELKFIRLLLDKKLENGIISIFSSRSKLGLGLRHRSPCKNRNDSILKFFQFFLFCALTFFIFQENLMANTSRVTEGNTAPDFTLNNQEGKPVALSDLLKKGNVVLYFYPKDETPGCTKEACSFRDNYEAFKEAGAQVVGISSDSAESHQKFASHHRLPFILLSDVGGKIRKLYGVPSTLGLLPGRVTYVIDKKGIVRKIFSSQFKATLHIEEALKMLKTLDKP